MNNCLIVCNGELSVRLILKFLKLYKPQKQFKIIAADGASDFLYKHKIIPDYIIGDLDSISLPALKYFSNKRVKIIKIIDQNKNDLEKCILYAFREGCKKLYIIGLTGKRLDHTINNLSILKKYSDKTDIKCYDDEFEYFIINKKAEFEYKSGEVVSLISLPKASGIKTKGLTYPLNNETLEFGVREGALNTASGKVVRIDIKNGYLLIIRKHFRNFD